MTTKDEKVKLVNPLDTLSEEEANNILEFGTNEELAELFERMETKKDSLRNYSHDAVDFVSMDSDTVSFSGYYLGLTIKSKKDGDEITLVDFFNPETGKRFQVYGAFNLLKFITENNFPTGHYLEVTKVGSKDIGNSKRMSLFDFQCNPESIKIGRIRRLESKKADEEKVLDSMPF